MDGLSSQGSIALDYPREGVVEYTGRAAGQDIHDFLQGDVSRALVELITNSDDAYRRRGRNGPITVKVEHGRRTAFNRVIVQDQAGGMSRQDIHERLLKAGAEASGHAQGLEVRGLQGRGAKDAAGFGRVEFETIRDGRFCRVEIHPDFSFRVLDDREARSADFQEHDIPQGGGGTKVVMFVERPRFSVPRHQNLAASITKHYQLRDILRSQQNPVRLVDLTNAQTPPETLRYTPPYELTLLEAKQYEFSVPGYPEAQCKLRFWRSAERLPDVRTPQRDGGVLVVGRYGIHDCTYFSFEGRIGALWYVGRLECPFIDTLQHQYDQVLTGKLKHDPKNPYPLISRKREGLYRGHPFYIALREEIEKRFEPLVKEEEDRESGRAGATSEENRRRLRETARQLASVYKEVAQEQELEIQDQGGVDTGSPSPIALEVVPPIQQMAVEETRSLSIRAWPSEWEPGAVPNPAAPVVQVRVEDDQVASVSPAEITLVPDKKVPGRWRGTVRVRAGGIPDATLLEIRLGRYDQTAIVEVVEVDDEPVVGPERLQFDHGNYRLRVGRSRTLVLMAPKALVESQSRLAATFRGTNPALRCPVSADFVLVHSDGQAWYEAAVEVSAPTTTDGAAGAVRLRADFAGQAAVCTINIVEGDSETPFDFEVVDQAPRYETAGRAEWSYAHGKKKLWIYAQHQALKRYFGEGMRHQNTILCRALVAEVLAEELATDLLKRERPGTSELARDAHAYDSQRRRLMARFLPVAHSHMVADSEVEA